MTWRQHTICFSCRTYGDFKIHKYSFFNFNNTLDHLCKNQERLQHATPQNTLGVELYRDIFLCILSNSPIFKVP